jgi:hypothetical protein
MNGLVTNALDLTKLRAPGASIKEALVPTEQLSFNFGLGNGMGLEVYTQFSADQVVIDPGGSYFGNDLMTGSQMIQAAGANDFENGNGGNCDWLLTAATSGAYYGINGEGLACNTTTVAKSANNFTTYHGASLLEQGLKHADSTDWSTSNTYGQSAGMAAHDTDVKTGAVSFMIPSPIFAIVTPRASWRKAKEEKRIQSGQLHVPRVISGRSQFRSQ